MKTLLLILLTTTAAHSQSLSVIPNGTSVAGSYQVGNTVSPLNCDGSDPDKLEVIIQPTCSGGNFRREVQHVDPTNDITMALSLNQNGNIFNLGVTFPARTMYPDYYGHICTPVGTTGANCTFDVAGESVTVTYSGCTYNTYGATRLPLARLNNCSRVEDTANHGELNKKVSCAFQYSGTSYNYSKTGYVSCGLVLSEDLLNGSSVSIDSTFRTGVSSTIAASNVGSTDGIKGAPGSLTIPLVGINFARRKKIYNGKKHKWQFENGSRKTTSSANFYQVKNNGSYKKLTNTNNGTVEFLKNGERCVLIKPEFKGQNRFCGSYKSPLMLFFTKERPMFNGISSFPLFLDQNPLVYWPESGSNGYFLVHDKNNNGKVDSVLELFGDTMGANNGFEALRPFDSNHDKVVDSKDKDFKLLKLWHDKNGDGITDEGELTGLDKKNVVSLSLRYQKDNKNFAHRAESREKSIFHFKKGGKIQRGMVLDIYFDKFVGRK